MMPLELYLAFIAACVLLALLPGPSMALMIAVSTTKGVRPGLAVLAGNTTGLTLLAAAVVIGMTPLLALLAHWFDVVRLAGAVYLLWLGAQFLRRGLRPSADQPLPEARSHRLYLQGLAVALSNPKVLLFLGALFPQFIDPAHPLLPQLVLLGASFVVTLAGIDLGIVLMSSFARRWLIERQKEMQTVSGVALIGAAMGLAFSRN